MAKARTLDPSFWDDPDIACLTRDERLLMVGMITCVADDEGRLLADPAYLRKRVFGYDEDLSKGDVEQLRDGIVQKCRNVKLYLVGGQYYITFLNWATYQSLKYVIASKLPEYTPQYEIVPGSNGESSGFPESGEISPQRGEISPLSIVKLSSVVLSGVTPQSAENAELPQPPPPRSVPKPKPQKASPFPSGFALTEDGKRWAATEGIDQLINLERCTRAFIEYWTEGEGQGKLKKNWVQTWRVWMRSEAEKAERFGGQRNGKTNGKNAEGGTKGLHSAEAYEQQFRAKQEALARRRGSRDTDNLGVPGP